MNPPLNPAPLPDHPVESITCATCEALCCRQQVVLIEDPDVPEHLTDWSDWGGQVMRRLDDGWCAALDRNTMRCTIYEVRPQICRDYQMGGLDCQAERRAGLPSD